MSRCFLLEVNKGGVENHRTNIVNPPRFLFSSLLKMCYFWQSEEEECVADTGVKSRRTLAPLYVYVCIDLCQHTKLWVLINERGVLLTVLIRCLREEKSVWGLKHEQLLAVLLPVSNRSLLSPHCECYLFITVTWLWGYPVLESEEENMTDKPNTDTLLETQRKQQPHSQSWWSL